MLGGGASKDDEDNHTRSLTQLPIANIILPTNLTNPINTNTTKRKKSKKKTTDKSSVKKTKKPRKSKSKENKIETKTKKETKKKKKETVKKGVEECDVCGEAYNKSTRAKIHCKTCEEEYCVSCAKEYICGSIKDVHCLSCQHRWDKGDMVEYINASFANKQYIEHRKEVLFQREQARFPETMPYVENLRKKDRYNHLLQEIYQLKTRYRKYENEMFIFNIGSKNDGEDDQSLDSIEYKINALHDKQKERMNVIVKKEYERKKLKKELEDKNILKKRKVTFIHACPAEGCKGFLSTAWKCGLCDMWTCSKCFELKGEKKDDEENPHVCKEENIQSAEMIKKDTKNCPKCAVPIYKLSGCDQMYCVVCQIAFSWKTGEIESGVIHNPHYFEYQRVLQQQQQQQLNMNLNQYAERNVCGPCGDDNMPNVHLYTGVINQSLNNKLITKYQSRFATELYRQVNHVDQTIVRVLRRTCNELQDNTDCRAKYIMSKMTKDIFVSELVKRENEFNQKVASLQLYDLLITVMRECINRIFAERTCISIDESLLQIKRLIRYINTELVRLSYIYNRSLVLYDWGNKYYYYSYKFCKDEYNTFKNNNLHIAPIPRSSYITDGIGRLLNLHYLKTYFYSWSYMESLSISLPLRRILVLSKSSVKNKKCIRCDETLTIPFYKRCGENDKFCHKCVFTQYRDFINYYDKDNELNIEENLDKEKKEIERLFKNGKLEGKCFTQDDMDRINNYKVQTIEEHINIHKTNNTDIAKIKKLSQLAKHLELNQMPLFHIR